MLLSDIFDPSFAIEPRYTAYTVNTRNGREISGIIAAQTPSSITLRSAGGTEEIFQRRDIICVTGSSQSLMPDAFEKALSAHGVADLIAYIRGKAWEH